ncbi:MAG: TfoX/Sxy family protein [Deltaproteobacteria bacterium]|nr:TfoX/Sxy family protein [Deltaproteobacteria bacterium]
MATRDDTIRFLLDQLRSLPGVRARKMFGEYAVYLDDKVVALVCDDQLFVKITPAGRALVGDRYEEGAPYPGAKPAMRLDIDEVEDDRRLCELIRATASALPPAKPRKARAPRRRRTGSG